ncbi:ROK family transcriptional regulator [Microbacterium sp. ASV49]|uniref:ROK family transcriptional regulator n=1 Tax=Microbacterium candidum TaxID=3041922 RepID=A0ABT7MX04_9MICO|nr:ROK family transcriptional regulator [Microbacterium sp. ASV49]MDL9978986.1 ROK family transcriptional regulator [Microbacterium sp. ASV49]
MTASEVQRGSSTIDSAPPAQADAHAFGPRRALRQGAKVLPEHARGHNRALVLQTLFHEGAMSRADLSRETMLTRVTISDLVAELIADGFVVERGVREASGPGKPAILVDLDRTGHRILALDLSASDRFVGAVLTLDGDIVSRRVVDHVEHLDDAAGIVIALARELAAESDMPILGMGVGTPGVVDDAGVVLTAPNFGWTDYDLKSALREAIDVPVLVANDANAAVLAEYTFGGSDDVLLVKIGRGVGSGLVIDGTPVRGSHSAAGEIGHVTVGTDGGPLCACGRHGCLEAWTSTPALSARIAGVAPEERDGILRDAGERLAIALAPVVGALDLSEVVLSGPPELLDGPLSQATAEILRSRTFAVLHDGIRVRMTEQGQDIVLRGAAVMVLSGQLGVS